MPRIPVIMPQLGESIAEATIVSILFQVGDPIESDQDVLEVETNKATMGVTPPCGGRIAEWLVEAGQSYPVGATLGFLEVSAEDAARIGSTRPRPLRRWKANARPASGFPCQRRWRGPSTAGTPRPVD